MEIRAVTHPKEYLPLLLIGDEEEAAVDRYLHQAETFVLFDKGEAKSICAVTREEPGLVEIRNLATFPSVRGRGFASALIDFVEKRYGNEAALLRLGTGETPSILQFYQRRGFIYSHRIPHFFRDNYALPIVNDGVLLDDMVYLQKTIGTTPGLLTGAAFLPAKRTDIEEAAKKAPERAKAHEPVSRDCVERQTRLPVDGQHDRQAPFEEG